MVAEIPQALPSSPAFSCQEWSLSESFSQFEVVRVGPKDLLAREIHDAQIASCYEFVKRLKDFFDVLV